VYLIFSLIDSLALSPVAGPEDPDHVLAVREADRQDPAFDPPEAVMALLLRAVGQVFRDHTLRIREGQLRLRERDSVLSLVRPILRRLPLEPGLWHQRRLARIGLPIHTLVWRDGQQAKATANGSAQRRAERVRWSARLDPRLGPYGASSSRTTCRTTSSVERRWMCSSSASLIRVW